MDVEKFETNEQVQEFLKFTGYQYSLASASSRIWGDPNNVEETTTENPFYQVMPDELDDGFFRWYSWVRAKYQFFRTPEMCVLYFIRYWIEWNEKGKPDWRSEEGGIE